MVISQGETWWANLPEPIGSGPGFRRPVIIIQSDAYNRSRIATVVCVPLTTNTAWADVPGNVFLTAQATSLPKDSVANTSHVISIDKSLLVERVGKVSHARLELILSGLDIVLGR